MRAILLAVGVLVGLAGLLEDAQAFGGPRHSNAIPIFLDHLSFGIPAANPFVSAEERKFTSEMLSENGLVSYRASNKNLFANTASKARPLVRGVRRDVPSIVDLMTGKGAPSLESERSIGRLNEFVSRLKDAYNCPNFEAKTWCLSGIFYEKTPLENAVLFNESNALHVDVGAVFVSTIPVGDLDGFRSLLQSGVYEGKAPEGEYEARDADHRNPKGPISHLLLGGEIVVFALLLLGSIRLLLSARINQKGNFDANVVGAFGLGVSVVLACIIVLTLLQPNPNHPSTGEGNRYGNDKCDYPVPDLAHLICPIPPTGNYPVDSPLRQQEPK